MKHSGFTFIEMLVALTITSILIVIITPSYTEFSNRQKANTEINRYLNFFKFARYTAASRTKFISICALEDSINCGDNWSKGLIVFEDRNVNGNIDNNETVIKYFERGKTESTLTLNASLNANFINYGPSGTSFKRSISGNLVYCQRSMNTNNSKALIISRSGRVYIAPDKNNNGVPENGSGNDITC
jgi:prepilin-type N-terminal cleavage/methylation domain-containing protein